MNENIYIKVQKENKKALLTSFTCCKVGNTGNDVKKYHLNLNNYFNCLPIPLKKLQSAVELKICASKS